jgi:hypothetical protein
MSACREACRHASRTEDFLAILRTRRTLETHLYGRGALHLGSIATYLGVAVGLDTNYLHDSSVDMSQTALGLGLNLDFGLAIAATPAFALDIGGDYYPGTDTLVDGGDLPVEDFAFRVGSTVRF